MELIHRFPLPRGVVVLAVLLTSLGCNFLNNLTHPDGLAITKFIATPSDITPGTTTMLSWDVQGADKVTIDNGIGTVSPSGSKELKPSWTTTFTLSAKG